MKRVLSMVPREALAGASVPDERFDPAWEPALRLPRREISNWSQYMAIASQVVGRFHGQFSLERFDYLHPESLQPATPRRLRKPYKVSVAYADWGRPDAPVLLCCGGVANVAMRFNYLASDLADHFRIVCMDWLGRGRSGWLADEGDYSLPTYVEQLRQLIMHLGGRPVIMLGSSMGGSAAIELIDRHPGLVARLILNDVGPHIPAQRRKRRAETIARHFVFHTPSELLRKVGASHKNDGPLADDVRFNLTFHQTRWSEDDGGRIYRHDVRALQAYRHDAQRSLQQWRQWRQVNCPTLLIHGLLSDTLLPPTIDRMCRGKPITVMHVPDTGHSPLLADRNQTWFIRGWLLGSQAAAGSWSVMHAPPREPYAGNPVHFAPVEALNA